MNIKKKVVNCHKKQIECFISVKMEVVDCYKEQIECFISDKKKYLLTEKKMNRDELIQFKMFPKLSLAQISMMHNKKTYLGNELKEGDMIFTAIIEKFEINKSKTQDLIDNEDDDFGFDNFITLIPIMLTEKEFKNYEVVRFDTNSVPYLKVIS